MVNTPVSLSYSGAEGRTDKAQEFKAASCAWVTEQDPSKKQNKTQKNKNAGCVAPACSQHYGSKGRWIDVVRKSRPSWPTWQVPSPKI